MKQRMKEPYEKGVAIRSASSLALGIARSAEARNARFPGSVLSLWLPDGSLNRAYSILIPWIASPPVIRDKNRMR
jgi:hypothetical protein